MEEKEEKKLPIIVLPLNSAFLARNRLHTVCVSVSGEAIIGINIALKYYL